jgi:hypothetical protein
VHRDHKDDELPEAVFQDAVEPQPFTEELDGLPDLGYPQQCVERAEQPSRPVGHAERLSRSRPRRDRCIDPTLLRPEEPWVQRHEPWTVRCGVGHLAPFVVGARVC